MLAHLATYLLCSTHLSTHLSTRHLTGTTSYLASLNTSAERFFLDNLLALSLAMGGVLLLHLLVIHLLKRRTLRKGDKWKGAPAALAFPAWEIVLVLVDFQARRTPRAARRSKLLGRSVVSPCRVHAVCMPCSLWGVARHVCALESALPPLLYPCTPPLDPTPAPHPCTPPLHTTPAPHPCTPPLLQGVCQSCFVAMRASSCSPLYFGIALVVLLLVPAAFLIWAVCFVVRQVYFRKVITFDKFDGASRKDAASTLRTSLRRRKGQSTCAWLAALSVAWADFTQAR